MSSRLAKVIALSAVGLIVLPLVGLPLYWLSRDASIETILLWSLAALASLVYAAGSIAASNQLGFVVTPSNLLALGRTKGLKFVVAGVCGYFQIPLVILAAWKHSNPG